MLVEDVFLDKLWTLELLSTQGTQVFVLRQLLDVVLHETSYFSDTVKKTCHGPTMFNCYTECDNSPNIQLDDKTCEDMLQGPSCHTSPCPPQIASFWSPGVALLATPCSLHTQQLPEKYAVNSTP